MGRGPKPKAEGAGAGGGGEGGGKGGGKGKKGGPKEVLRVELTTTRNPLQGFVESVQVSYPLGDQGDGQVMFKDSMKKLNAIGVRMGAKVGVGLEIRIGWSGLGLGRPLAQTRPYPYL